MDWKLTNLLMKWFNDVRPILPNARPKFDANDVLFLPDTGGLDLNNEGYHRLNQWHIPPVFPPQAQAMEYFRRYTLEYFRKKGGDIVAFGNTAVMMHEVEGGKFTLDGFKAIPKIGLSGTDYHELDDQKWYYMRKNVFGVEEYSDSNEFKRLLFNFLRIQNNGSHEGAMINELAVPPKTGGGINM